MNRNISIIYWIFVFIHVGLVLSDSATAVESTFEDYRPLGDLFSLLDVYNIEWRGADIFAWKNETDLLFTSRTKFENETYLPVALIIDPNEDNVSVLTDCCALQFELAARRTNRVNIDGIIVKVHSYEPLPENLIYMQWLPWEESIVYYAEIDNPELNNTTDFKAQLVKESIVLDSDLALGSVYVEQDKPEQFVLRINAKTPGVYSFSIAILVRCQDIKERVLIMEDSGGPFKFIFIRQIPNNWYPWL